MLELDIKVEKDVKVAIITTLDEYLGEKKTGNLSRETNYY